MMMGIDPANILGIVIIDGEDPLPDEEFKLRFIAAAGKNAWDQLVHGATNPAVFKIRYWRETHTSDPISDSKLMAELRQVYQAIPGSAVKLEFVRGMAAELELTIRQVESLIGGQTPRQTGDREMPPFKGVR